ncbi:MAG: DNA primase [Planctomycetes bacterium]|nr:DNA primase [Planctomycetota bacterium]
MRVPDEKKLEIQRATDIVELIQQYVPLKRSGASFKGLCPFHNEKTPSFHVNPARQIFHCFGCHKGGDVFSFLVEHDKVTFPEALRILGERAGIRLDYESSQNGVGSGQRAAVLKANAFAADFYHRSWLEGAHSAGVRAYVEKRGISAGTAAQFKIGYAPEAWEALLGNARRAGIDDKTLELAGLVSPRSEGHGHYDRFRNRLMFPIWDGRNEVIGFGARTLDGREPKYLNSPETPVFSKGRCLYGLNFARSAAAKTNALAIVEGYTDVVVAHQFGFANVVATLGTALTEEHLRVLRRYGERVYVVYDGDAAGEKAADRSLDLFLRENVELRVVTLPAGLDPDEVLLQRGAEAFQACLDAAKELFDYRLDVAVRRFGAGSLATQAQVIDEILGSLLATTNPVRRDLSVMHVAGALRVDEKTLRLRLRERSAARAALPRPASAAPGTGASAPASGGAPLRASGARLRDPAIEAAEWLIEALLAAPEAIPMVRERVPLEDFPDDGTRRIAGTIFDLADSGHEVTAAAVTTILGDDPLARRVIELADQEFPRERAATRIDESARTLEIVRLKAQAAEHKRRMIVSTDPEEKTRLAMELESIRKAQHEKL